MSQISYANTTDENNTSEIHVVTDASESSVDKLQRDLNSMMQFSASWLDNIIFNESKSTLAAANGYLQLSWLPRTEELDDIDIKFKVYLHLPKWSERLSLVLDNDDENEIKLDYETDKSELNQDSNQLNLAIQYIKNLNNGHRIKNRIGVSREQLYVRSEINFDWQNKNVDIKLIPRIDYFNQDGLGPGVKTGIVYSLIDSKLSFSASWQKRQKESKSRSKIGFYYIKTFYNNRLLVSGFTYSKDSDKNDKANERYIGSIRYRHLFYKSWMYIEVEPFIEFNQMKDYQRELGIAFRLISYYGK